MRRYWYLLFIAFAFAGSVAAGTLGKWKSYTSKKEIRGVVVVDSVVWAATSGGAFSYNLRNGALELFTTSEGLRAIDLTAITMDDNRNIWFGASNGALQRYSPSTRSWEYISGIVTAPDEPQKRINALKVQSDTLFILSELGVSVFSISRMEFGDTYKRFGVSPSQIAGKAHAVELFQENFWVATANGIAFTPMTNLNPSAPGSWQIINSGLPSVNVRDLAVYHDTLFAATAQGISFFNGSAWETLPVSAGKDIISFSDDFSGAPSVSSMLYYCTGTELWSYGYGVHEVAASGFESNLSFLSSNGVAGTVRSGVVINSAVTIEPLGANWLSIIPEGPHTNRFSGIAVDEQGVLWSGTGSSSGEGFMSFDGTTWKPYLPATNPVYNGAGFAYIIDIGSNNSKWISTFGDGVVQLNAHNEIERFFNTTNGLSYTNNSSNNQSFVVVTGVVTDRSGDVWINVRGAGDRNLLAIYSPGVDTLRRVGYPLGYPLPNLLNIAIDSYGTKWFTSASIQGSSASPGLVFYDESRTLPRRLNDNTGWGVVTVAEDGLTDNEITSVAIDMDGYLWVGTAEGGINIIIDPRVPYRILPYHPLAGQKVNDILVDPLNQKWVATERGIFLLSPDGTTIAAEYSEETTGGKIPDNHISSLAMNRNDGTIYFATESGLATLSTAAVTPRVSFDELKIYPNPFTLPPRDSLTIDGLVENSSIKILSVSGNLVKSVSTLGGRVGSWDGTDEQGEYVASGVYIVVAYSRDGSAVGKGKVAVIRK